MRSTSCSTARRASAISRDADTLIPLCCSTSTASASRALRMFWRRSKQRNGSASAARMRSSRSQPMGSGLSEGYLELRRKTAARDRSLHEKVVSLDEAAKLVKDGDLVGIGGSTLSRTPIAMIWALIRAGRKRLTCARGIMSSDGELLFGSGACDHVIPS